MLPTPLQLLTLFITTCFTYDRDIELSNDELFQTIIQTSYLIVSIVIYIHCWHKRNCCCYHLIFFNTTEMMIFSFGIIVTAWNEFTKNCPNRAFIFQPTTWLIQICCFNSYHQLQTRVSSRNLVVRKKRCCCDICYLQKLSKGVYKNKKFKQSYKICKLKQRTLSISVVLALQLTIRRIYWKLWHNVFEKNQHRFVIQEFTVMLWKRLYLQKAICVIKACALMK